MGVDFLENVSKFNDKAVIFQNNYSYLGSVISFVQGLRLLNEQGLLDSTFYSGLKSDSLPNAGFRRQLNVADVKLYVSILTNTIKKVFEQTGLLGQVNVRFTNAAKTRFKLYLKLPIIFCEAKDVATLNKNDVPLYSKYLTEKKDALLDTYKDLYERYKFASHSLHSLILFSLDKAPMGQYQFMAHGLATHLNVVFERKIYDYSNLRQDSFMHDLIMVLNLKERIEWTLLPQLN